LLGKRSQEVGDGLGSPKQYNSNTQSDLQSELPELLVEDQSIVSAIMQWKSAVQAAKNPWREWQKKNDWRAEGLLKFVGLRLPLPMIQIDTPIPPSKLLFDLPSCCYDVHTRVGLNVLQRLVRGVNGAEGIKDFFQENEIRNAHRALGEVLFSVEGGRIRGGTYTRRADLRAIVRFRTTSVCASVWTSFQKNGEICEF
jgi:hypothetical protein